MSGKHELLWARLKARVESVERGLDGVLGVAVKDLTTGATLQVNADEVFPAASTLKMAILYEGYRQAEEGRLRLDEVTCPSLPRVGGGGVLQELSAQVSLTWRDLAVLMMGWSDNEATNLLIDKVGLEAVNSRLAGLGLETTRLRRKMMDVAAAQRGLENVATPAELSRLMEAYHAGTGLPPERAADLRKIASIEKWGTTTPGSPFRGPLPPTLVVADKTGELDGVRCVTALVLLEGRPYVATLMTSYLRRDAEGEAAIRDLSAALYETFDRLARYSALGRVIR
jgi:beta-lactamase class A